MGGGAVPGDIVKNLTKIFFEKSIDNWRRICYTIIVPREWLSGEQVVREGNLQGIEKLLKKSQKNSWQTPLHMVQYNQEKGSDQRQQRKEN